MGGGATVVGGGEGGGGTARVVGGAVDGAVGGAVDAAGAVVVGEVAGRAAGGAIDGGIRNESGPAMVDDGGGEPGVPVVPLGPVLKGASLEAVVVLPLALAAPDEAACDPLVVRAWAAGRPEGLPVAGRVPVAGGAAVAGGGVAPPRSGWGTLETTWPVPPPTEKAMITAMARATAAAAPPRAAAGARLAEWLRGGWGAGCGAGGAGGGGTHPSRRAVFGIVCVSQPALKFKRHSPSRQHRHAVRCGGRSDRAGCHKSPAGHSGSGRLRSGSGPARVGSAPLPVKQIATCEAEVALNRSIRFTERSVAPGGTARSSLYTLTG